MFLYGLILCIILIIVRAVAASSNCNIPLNTDDRTSGCFASVGASTDGSFVCDITASWMHHVGGSSDRAVATPPQGTVFINMPHIRDSHPVWRMDIVQVALIPRVPVQELMVLREEEQITGHLAVSCLRSSFSSAEYHLS